MYDLKNKWAFITGAGSGIGYETCLAFAKQGCNVIATDIDRDRLDEVVQVTQKFGIKVEGHVLDVSDEEAFKTLAQAIIEKHACPDVVVNNAGILLMGDVASHDTNMWQRTFNINVMGVVFGTQAFLKAMSETKVPKFIVNISSQASRTPYVYMSAYAASKYAVEGFTDSLRTELAVTGSNIRPISIHPGVINTKVIPTTGSGFSQKAMENIQRKYDTKGSHPSVVANDIVNAVRKDKAAVMTGSMATLGFWLDKLLSKKIVAKLVADAAIKDGFTLNVR